jgi:proteasome lid subunit RPN8/RPN11
VFNPEDNMFLTKEIESGIVHQAEIHSPDECCGFILSNDDSNFLFHCENKFGKRFQISSVDYLAAKEKGQIEAVYHSHTNGNEEFSELDKKNSLYHGIKFILYSLKSNSFKEFGYDTKYKKYVGKFFKIGEEDCFSLVRDFYKTELDVNIKDYSRNENWSEQDDSLFDLYYEDEGFTKVNDIKKYDIIIFNSPFRRGFSGHIAVYLGDSLMLHNQTNSFSKIEEYSEAYKRLTNYIIRHKDLL